MCHFNDISYCIFRETYFCTTHDKMSGQGTQRVRKSSPCPAKQGPMRATLPMSSLMRQGSNIRKSKSNSPTISPPSAWKTRTSPDATLSGQRSPGSLSYRAKSKTLNARQSSSYSSVSCIRRTASLDTIYLKGQWPRESFYMYCGQLLVDKATQTPEEWSGEPKKTHRYLESCNEDKLDKYIRHKLQRTNKENNRERTALMQPNPVHGDHSVLSSSQITSLCTPTSSHPKGIPIPNIPKPLVPRMRNSIEGLNQEIERLVLKATSAQDAEREEEKTCQQTPEGHRAPLADLLRSTRSVNTQTPGAGRDFTESSQSSGPPSRESVSPLIPGTMDTSRPPSDLQVGSRSPSPDQDPGKLGTSPHINKFLAREPPDGCEKVNLKFVEETRRPMIDLSKIDYCPLKPCVKFELKPSLGSAFYPLPKTLVLEDGENSPTIDSGETKDLPLMPGTSFGDAVDRNSETTGM